MSVQGFSIAPAREKVGQSPPWDIQEALTGVAYKGRRSHRFLIHNYLHVLSSPSIISMLLSPSPAAALLFMQSSRPS